MPDTRLRHKKRSKVSQTHCRSLQHRSPFVFAVIWTSIHYLCLLGTITAFVAFFLNPTKLATEVILACVILAGLSWWIAFFRRRAAHCPLCKGTPLVNSGALTHQKALRIGPLNHGVTAILSVIAKQGFRCMYCGSDFDMLKTPARLRHLEREAAPPENAE